MKVREFSMRIYQFFIIILCLAGCSLSPSLRDPKLSEQQLNLEEFFNGNVIAYGQFQDVLGTVSRRFNVNIHGTLNQDQLTLTENFSYSDGTTEQRIWNLTKVGDQKWTGFADGVQGKAEGEESGDTFYWNYTIDLPLPDGKMRVTFNDYMWLLSPNRMLNKAYMSKWGIPLGEVTIIFEKQ